MTLSTFSTVFLFKNFHTGNRRQMPEKKNDHFTAFQISIKLFLSFCSKIFKVSNFSQSKHTKQPSQSLNTSET